RASAPTRTTGTSWWSSHGCRSGARSPPPPRGSPCASARGSLPLSAARGDLRTSSLLVVEDGEHVVEDERDAASVALPGEVELDSLAQLVEFGLRRIQFGFDRLLIGVLTAQCVAMLADQQRQVIPLGLGLLHALDQGAHDAARLGFAIPCRVAVRESSGFVQQVVAHDSSSGSYSTRNGAYRKSISSSLVNESSLPGVHQRSGRSSSFCHAVPVAPSTT